MNKPLAWVLLAVGIVLLVFGIQESHSFASGVSKAVTGSPTDHSIWLIAGGVVATVTGLFGFRG